MGLVDVHAIIGKLVEVADASVTGFQVLDGRTFKVALEDRVLVIGYTGNQLESAVTIDRSIEDGSPIDTQYDVTIRCSINVQDGEEEYHDKRAVVQAALAQMNAALEANVSLDATVMEAYIAPTMALFQFGDTEGNEVEVAFTVVVTVFA